MNSANAFGQLLGSYGLVIALIVFLIVLTRKSLQVVSQSEEYVIERLGKYTQTLSPGISFLVPFIDNVAHKVSILERQLDSFTISVITKDNVERTIGNCCFF